MSIPLRVLIVEDSEDDAALLLHALSRGGYETTHERVDTSAAMIAALDRQPWDVIIADYAMPRFSGLDALSLLKDRGLDLPFIVVSGTIGEEVAVEAMKAGAHDYVMKGNLTRLIPAVARELRDAEERRERRRAEERLQRDALYDALTGLPNRALFMDRLGLALGRAKRHTPAETKIREEYRFGVLFVDLDRFKVVIDSLGHLVGDQLLIAIARMLEKCVRPGDTVARLGGDEFAVLLDEIQTLNDPTRVAERIQKHLVRPFNLPAVSLVEPPSAAGAGAPPATVPSRDGEGGGLTAGGSAEITASEQDVFISASIGIALGDASYERPEEVLRDANTAMHRAKALGKARHEVFEQAMHASAVERLRLETDLRRAVERREFLVYYQPIVSLKTGRISGFEALVRWLHPQRGIVGPVEFIPLAEDNGLILPIGEWVLREACRQMSDWRNRHPAAPPATISVNLSGKQFSQSDLVGLVKKILRETRLDPRLLHLEITESVIMEYASAAETLKRLKDLDVRLHIDDFGTGYSSLSHLHRFPIDTLKIDRSFVSRMGDHPENLEIVRTIVSLAHNMRMDVVAEGVETAEQLAQLRALGCEHGQGFYFSKPADAETAGKWFETEPKW